MNAIDVSFEINELNEVFNGYYPYKLTHNGDYKFTYESCGDVKPFWPCGYTQDVSIKMIERLIRIGAKDIKIISCEKADDGLLYIKISFYYCI